MAAILKRKYMPRTALNEDFALPTSNQQVAQMMGTKGSQLHEVRTADGSTFLVSLPAKWRKRTWVKRGDYVFVELISEGRKVRGQIVNVLTADHVTFLYQQNVWPSAFTPEDKKSTDNSEEDFWRNPNRPAVSDEETSDSDSSEDDEGGSENGSCTSEDELENEDGISKTDFFNSAIKGLSC